MRANNRKMKYNRETLKINQLTIMKVNLVNLNSQRVP